MRLLLAIAVLFSVASAYDALGDPCFSGCCAKYNGILGEVDNAKVPSCLADANCMIVYDGATRGSVDVACVKASYTNTQNPYDQNAIGSCIAACGGPYTPPASSPFNSGGGSAAAPFPPCADTLGEVYQLSGDGTIARQGTTKAVAVGDIFCDGDTVSAGAYSKVFIRFSDGNVRVVSNGGAGTGVLHVTTAPDQRVEEVNGMVEMLTTPNTREVIKRLLSTSDERVLHSQMTGGNLNEPIYTPHSKVIFNFSTDGDTVSVIEGNVDVVDAETGQTMAIPGGQSYHRALGQAVAQGTLYPTPSGVQDELANTSCCGTAFVLALTGAFALKQGQ